MLQYKSIIWDWINEKLIKKSVINSSIEFKSRKVVTNSANDKAIPIIPNDWNQWNLKYVIG